MQTIQVQAIVGDGHDRAYRAGRKWPANEPASVEVLDQDDDPPMIEVEVDVGGVKARRQIPDPHRIGRRSFAALKADPRLRILGDRDTSAQQSSAALNKARALAGSLSAENADLKVKLAGAEERIRELEAQLAPPPPPGDEPEPEPELAEEAVTEPVEGGLHRPRRKHR